jgi:uncharacterized protein (DUF2345 family)
MRARRAILLALVTVAACEEFSFSDPATTEDEAYLALQAETLALRDATEFLAVTDAVDLPNTGSATYEGTALIALDAPAGGVASELIGDASIVADFEAATVSGQADGFYGTVNGGDVAAFEGTIFVSQGAIDSSNVGNDQIAADVNGTLSGGGDTLVVDGAVAGNFLGDPLLLNEAPEALSLATDDATTFRLNGEDVTGGMEVIGTN